MHFNDNHKISVQLLKTQGNTVGINYSVGFDSCSILCAGNYTDLVTLTMGCSQPGFPSLTLTVEPKLRSQIEQIESMNPKVAFSIRCERNGAINYMNSSVVVSSQHLGVYNDVNS